MKSPGKILIVRFSSIGDIILTTPLVRAIKNKYPDAQLDYVTKSEYTDLLKNNPNLDNIVTFDSVTGFKGLRKVNEFISSQEYDIFVDIHTSLRSRFLRLFSKSEKILTYNKEHFKRNMLLRFKVNMFDEIVPAYLKYFRAVKELGIEYDGQGTDFFVDDNSEKKVMRLLEKKMFDKTTQLVTICPGAGYFTKRWTTDGFAKVADSLVEKYNVSICLNGSDEDKEICIEIRRKMKQRAMITAGQLSILASGTLLKKSNIVISNDTGMMHLAQAVKTPVLAIFGPTSKELGFFPIPEDSVVMQNKLDCSPCKHNGSKKCPKRHFKCMKDLEAAKVADAAAQLLESTMERKKF